MKGSDNPFPSVLVAEQGAAPTTPATGYGRIYCKTDGLYFVGDDGVEVGPLAAAGAGGGYTEGAKVYNSADQALTQNDWTTLAFNNEVWDTDTIHDNSTNNSRLTCKTAGKYLVQASAIIGDLSTTARKIQMQILVNGTAVHGSNTKSTSTSYVNIDQSTILNLAENDYVQFQVHPGDVASQNAYGSWSPISVWALMQRVG